MDGTTRSDRRFQAEDARRKLNLRAQDELETIAVVLTQGVVPPPWDGPSSEWAGSEEPKFSRWTLHMATIIIFGIIRMCPLVEWRTWVPARLVGPLLATLKVGYGDQLGGGPVGTETNAMKRACLLWPTWLAKGLAGYGVESRRRDGVWAGSMARARRAEARAAGRSPSRKWMVAMA